MAVDQVLGPPAPAAGHVAGEAVGQVAGAAGGQGPAGGAGEGQGEEAVSAAVGDQGGKLCSMQMHGGRGRRKTENGRKKLKNNHSQISYS